MIKLSQRLPVPSWMRLDESLGVIENFYDTSGNIIDLHPYRCDACELLTVITMVRVLSFDPVVLGYYQFNALNFRHRKTCRIDQAMRNGEEYVPAKTYSDDEYSLVYDVVNIRSSKFKIHFKVFMP